MLSNHKVQFILISTIFLIFIYAFSNSYTSRNMDNLSYVVAIRN